MGREIKFRCWNESTKEMLANVGFHPHLAMDLSAEDGYYKTNPEGRWLMCPAFKHPLMQYTGLKDKNGKEIYEWDIYSHNDNKYVCVFTENSGIQFIQINKNLKTILQDRISMMHHNRRSFNDVWHIRKFIEVIGNIYENPELLK